MATELTGLHAKFTGDSSDFRAAAGAAIGLVDRFGQSLKSAASEQTAAAAAAKKLADDYHKLKLETDANYAATSNYNKAAELATRIAKEQQWSVEALNAELAQLAAHYGVATTEISSAEKAAAAAAAATKKLESDYHKLRLETDANFAATTRYNTAAELATRIAKSQKWSTEALNAELARLAGHYGVAEAASEGLNHQIKSARFHAANLTAQFYDIGVMMSAGQSPFMTGIQQGSQMSQIWLAAGGSVKQSGKMMLSAIAGLISPMSLLTIGAVAAVAALGQWAMAAMSAAQRTDELKAKQEAFTEVVDGLTEATKRLRDERELANSEAQGLEELEGLRARAALLDELAQNQAEINRLTEIGGRAVAHTEGKEASREALEARRKELELALRRLDYEQELEAAEKRRANAYRDAAKARFQAEQDQLTALQAQEAAEARQQELLTLRKNGFHMLAGETAAVSFYLGQGLEIATGLEEVDLDSSVAAAANSAATLARNLGISLENAQRMLQLGYESSGPVIFDPRDPNYDPAKAAQASQFGFTYGNGKEPPKPAAATGAGSTANALESELEQLRNSLLTQEQLEIESYARRQAVLEDALRQKLITQGEYSAMMEQAEASHQFAMLQASNDGARNVLGSLEQVFQGSKKISAAIALANSYLAFTEVLKDPSYVGRPFARFAAAAAALSSGFQAVAAIKGVQPGSSAGGALGGGGSAGAAGGGTSTQVSLQLVGGDLYSRDQVISLINAINSAVADGAQITVR